MKAVLKDKSGNVIRFDMVVALITGDNTKIDHQTTGTPDGQSIEYYYHSGNKPMTVRIVFIYDGEKVVENIETFYLYIPVGHPIKNQCGIVGYGNSKGEFVLSLSGKPILKDFVKK